MRRDRGSGDDAALSVRGRTRRRSACRCGRLHRTPACNACVRPASQRRRAVAVCRCMRLRFGPCLGHDSAPDFRVRRTGRMNMLAHRLSACAAAAALTALLVTAPVADARDTLQKLSLSSRSRRPRPPASSRRASSCSSARRSTRRPTAKLGETRTNKKTNFFNKTDVEGCEWAFLSSMIALTQYAQRVGGNAIVNIRSNYKNNVFSSETEYECGRRQCDRRHRVHRRRGEARPDVLGGERGNGGEGGRGGKGRRGRGEGGEEVEEGGGKGGGGIGDMRGEKEKGRGREGENREGMKGGRGEENIGKKEGRQGRGWGG